MNRDSPQPSCKLIRQFKYTELKYPILSFHPSSLHEMIWNPNLNELLSSMVKFLSTWYTVSLPAEQIMLLVFI